MTWVECRLDELGYVSRGRSRHRPRDDASLYGGAYPFLQTADVKHSDLYIKSHTQTYNEKGLAQSRLWSADTLCITIAANIADTAILAYDACFPDSIIGFVADPTRCDVRYIKYFFDTVQLRYKQIAQGAAQDNLSQQKLLSLSIPTPPLETQQRIADILATYDRLIDNNSRRIALLEESIHLLYQEWFVRSRFPGYEEVEVIDGVPEGWSYQPLEEVCELIMGQSPPSEFYNNLGQGLPFHQGVSNFGNRFASHEIYCTQLNRIAEPGDILCSVRAPVGRLNISLDRIIIGRGLSAIRNRQGYQSFQYYQLKKHFFKEDLIGGGAIFASVTKKQLGTQMMLIPLEQVIKAFEAISKPVDQQIVNLHFQNQKLKEARDRLLPRLMNGSIAV